MQKTTKTIFIVANIADDQNLLSLEKSPFEVVTHEPQKNYLSTYYVFPSLSK